jgi:hypothetical protein
VEQHLAHEDENGIGVSEKLSRTRRLADELLEARIAAEEEDRAEDVDGEERKGRPGVRARSAP